VQTPGSSTVRRRDDLPSAGRWRDEKKSDNGESHPLIVAGGTVVREVMRCGRGVRCQRKVLGPFRRRALPSQTCEDSGYFSSFRPQIGADRERISSQASRCWEAHAMSHARTKLLAVGVFASLGAAIVACSSPGDGTILIGVDDAAPAPVLAPPVNATHDAGVAPTAPASTSMAPTAPAPTSTAPTTPTSPIEDAGSPAPVPSPTAPTTPGGFDQFQERNLADINDYRATLGIAPLVLDQTLCTFALAGSDELSQNHSPHAHFIGASDAGATPRRTSWTRSTRFRRRCSMRAPAPARRTATTRT
jgi:hypothetical protein